MNRVQKLIDRSNPMAPGLFLLGCALLIGLPIQGENLENVCRVRVEWGFAPAALKGFAAPLPAYPGGPTTDQGHAIWFMALGAKNARIIDAEVASNSAPIQPVGASAWELVGAGRGTAAVEVKIGLDASASENLLVIRTDPQTARGFCVDLAQLREAKAIYAPALGYFFSADPQLTLTRFLREREQLLAEGKIPARTIVQVQEAPEQSYGAAGLLSPEAQEVRTFLGWPDFATEFLVYRNGDVTAANASILQTHYPTDTELTLCVGTGGSPDFRRGFDEKYPQEMPDGYTLRTHWRTDGIEYEQEMFVAPLHGLKASAVNPKLLGMIRYRARNPGNEKRPARFWFAFTGAGYDRAQTGKVGRAQPELDYKGDLRLDADLLMDGERIRCQFVSPGAELVFQKLVRPTPRQECDPRYQVAADQNLLKNVVVCEVMLAPGETKDLVVKLPFYPLPLAEKDALRKWDYQQAHRAVISYWNQLIAPGMRTTVPEEIFNLVSKTLLPHMLPVADTDADGTLVPMTAPLHYQWCWLMVTASTTIALDVAGYHDLSRRYLDSIITWQGHRKPPGDFISTEGCFGAPDPYSVYQHVSFTGYTIWAICEHYLYTRDDEWLRRNGDRLIAGCDWIIRERRAAMARLGDPQNLGYGLLPRGKVSDSEKDIGLFLFSDGASCNGLLRAARVLRAINHPQAERIAAEADAYRADLLKAIEQAVARRPLVKLKDQTWIPFVPPSLDGSGRDQIVEYVNQVDVGPTWLMEFGVVPADSPWMDYLLNDHEDNLYREGLADEPYLSAQYLPYLLRDQISCYVRALYNQLALGMSRATLMRFEHRSMGEDRRWDLTIADAEFFRRYVQGLLLMVDDEIWIGRGTPRRWLADGQDIVLERAPTYFGRMNVRIHSDADHGSITATIDPPQRNPYKSIRLRLRHPQSARLTRATVNGLEWKDFDSAGETITLPSTHPSLKVIAYY